MTKKIKKYLLVLSRLIGIKFTENKVDFKRLLTATWAFLIGTPIGLTLFGSGFPVIIWGVVIFLLLVIVNSDDAIDLSRV